MIQHDVSDPCLSVKLSKVTRQGNSRKFVLAKLGFWLMKCPSKC